MLIKIQSMNRRVEARLRLEKISQNSSPSPKRQTNTQMSDSRLIPFASTSIPPSPKKTGPSHEQRNKQLNTLREEIMDRRQQLTLWEQTFLKRTFLNTLALGVTRLSQHPDIRLGYLRAVKRGRKGILLWILGWLSTLFGMLRVLLAQRNLHP